MHYPGLSRMTVPYFIRTGSMLISTSGIPRPLTLQEDHIIVPVKRRVMSHGVPTYGNPRNSEANLRGRRVRRVQTRADSSPRGPIGEYAGVVHGSTVQEVCSTSCIGERRSRGAARKLVTWLAGWGFFR